MEESNEYDQFNQTKHKPPSFSRKPFQPPPVNPLSPRDTTPIIVNGNTISREDITPIIDHQVMNVAEDQTATDTIATTDITMEQQIEEKDLPPKILNQVPNQEKSPQQEYYINKSPTPEFTRQQPQPMPSKTTSQIIEEQTSAIFKDTEIEFPRDNPSQSRQMVSSNIPFKNQRTSIIDHVESTDNSEYRSPGPIPRVTSPTDQMSAEQKLHRTLPPNILHLPKKDPDVPNNPEYSEDVLARAHDCYLKYQILQKSWPEYKFPNLDEKLVYSNPKFIIDTYDRSVQRIQIDMDVNQYKIALIIMFLVIEVVCVKFLGLDAGGYTLSQIKAMNRYEKLLIEIGEKKLIMMGGNWSPEVRILFIGLFNCGLFILMKYLSSILGPELVGYISPIVNGLFSGVFDSSKTASLPDEVPQRQQDISGMLGGFATMAANALGGQNNANATSTGNNNVRKASRRPIYRS
jgi:hypothetical protein